jgi:hypothetical protein
MEEGQDNELLDGFRTMWQNELRQENKEKDAQAAKEETALALYKQASDAENQGNLSLAIENYRKAVRQDPDVEEKFRSFILSKAPPKPTPTPPVVSLKRDGALPDLSTVLKLPEEIATLIFKRVIGVNLEVFTTLSLVSPGICALLKDNETIFRHLAREIHGPIERRELTWYKTLVEVQRVYYNSMVGSQGALQRYLHLQDPLLPYGLL